MTGLRRRKLARHTARFHRQVCKGSVEGVGGAAGRGTGENDPACSASSRMENTFQGCVRLGREFKREKNNVVSLTALALQSRFGDNWGQITWNLSCLSPKRDRSSKRVKLYFYQSAGGYTYIYIYMIYILMQQG